MNQYNFWLHSFGVGVIAKQLLHKRGKDISNEGFMGGILHDIGRLVFVRSDCHKYAAFKLKNDKVIDTEAEQNFFGIDHQRLGELLARKWNFPESIVGVISRHHNPPVEGEYCCLISAVNIADMLCHALAIGDSGSYYISSFSESAWRLLGISVPELEIILSRSLDEIDSGAELLSDIKS